LTPRTNAEKDMNLHFAKELPTAIEKLMDDPSFNIIEFQKKYTKLVNEHPIQPKEVEYLLEHNRTPVEQLGVELENPVLEECILCDQLFEANHKDVINLPFCGHRVHMACLQKEKYLYCKLCGNPLRTSLFCTIRGKNMEQVSKINADAQAAFDENPIVENPLHTPLL
jgi:hypothetical protein